MSTQPKTVLTAYNTTTSAAAWYGRLFPSLSFYCGILPLVFKAMFIAQKGKLDAACLASLSFEAVTYLERSGVRLHIDGLEQIIALKRPVVVVANHMSTLETFALPWLCAGFGATSFVVKESLAQYPVFRHALYSMQPICVTRTSPRQDLKTVLEQGAARLKAGRSVIIFPQTTRNVHFVPEQFTSIGAKLASRAGAPLVPLALQTHAWGAGRLIKDLGGIYPQRPVYFQFGPPLFPTSDNAEAKVAHAASIQFIAQQLAQWNSGH